MAALSKGFGNALSFGSSFIQKAASVTKDNAVKIGNAAAHAGGEIGKKAADGSLTNQGSAVLGSAFGKYKLVFLSGIISGIFKQVTRVYQIKEHFQAGEKLVLVLYQRLLVTVLML